MTVKGWVDRGLRALDVEPPARVHILDDGQPLCGAAAGPGDLTREALRTVRRRPLICWACDDVIWRVRRPRKVAQK